MEIVDILGAAFPPTPVAIEVKFCTAKRTHVPLDIVMVTPRILREVEREIPEMGGRRRKGGSEFSLFINKNDFNSFTAVKS